MSTPATAGVRVVALTGATGFIGSTLLNKLHTAGWHVRALYRPRRGRVLTPVAGVEWLPGSLDDAPALAELVRGAQAVIHCAGTVRGITRTDFDHVNEAGTRHMALAAAHEPTCRRFVLISSLAAREPGLSHYAGSKRRGEQALATHAGDLCWSILRPAAVFGPGDREMAPLFRSMARGWCIQPAGTGYRFSLLYVDDLATAVLSWLTQKHASGGIYELDDGCEHGYDWAAVAHTASRVLRQGKPVHHLRVPIAALRLAAGINAGSARLFGYAPMLTPGKLRELTHADWVCDNSSFAHTTGWHPAFNLERGLAQTFTPPATAANEIQR